MTNHSYASNIYFVSGILLKEMTARDKVGLLSNAKGVMRKFTLVLKMWQMWFFS